MRFLIARLIVACSLVMGFSATACCAADVLVQRATGEQVSGPLQELSADRVSVLVQGTIVELSLDSVRSVVLSPPEEALADTLFVPRLTLANGDELPISELMLSEEKFSIASAAVGSGVIPLDAVKKIQFADKEAAIPALITSTIPADVALLKNGDILRGTVQSLSAGELSMETNLGLVRTERENLVLLEFNPQLLRAIPESPRQNVVEFANGGWLTTTASTWAAEGPLTLRHVLGFELQCELSAARRMSLYGPTVVSLTSRIPLEVNSRNYFGTEQPVQTNLNFRRRPLQTGGQRFLRGFGMTSHTRLRFGIEPGDELLLTGAGLDDSAGKRGRLEMHIELDGRRVWTSGEIGAANGVIPVPPLALSGATTLTLVVDFGPDADIQDLANWCDPVIIRKSP